LPNTGDCLQIIRKSSFKAVPWKNGGGVTHEIIRNPATGDPFQWRMSVAHIDGSGPFSDFSGYRRHMVLLQGQGLTLRFKTGDDCLLREVGDLAQFDGAATPHCDLLGGPCVDLNLMVAESLRAEARVLRLTGKSAMAAPSARALIFSIEAPLWLEWDGGETVKLEPWDLAVVQHGGVLLSAIDPDISACAVFFATINH